MHENKQFWDRVAKIYAPIQDKTNRKLYDELIKLSSKYLKADMRVLELACGSGQLTIPLCKLVKRYEASDYSTKMIKVAMERCPKNVELSIQDARHLEYPCHSFDAVIIANALHVMEDYDTVLKEIRRVLKPNGVLIAPSFVYEGKVNRFRLYLTNLIGFPAYQKWDLASYAEVIKEHGFKIAEEKLIPADPIPEGFVAAYKLISK